MKPSISWLTVVLWSTCWIAVLAAPMATEVDVRVDDRQQPGCLYNDQLYAEGETVPTKESCLNCSCRQGALRCHLQVCPYAHDLYPPPVGCILVERKGGCCPKLHCPDHIAQNGLARKDPSGQLSSWKLRDDLRRRLFKQISRHASDKQGCIEGGTAYADGSGMMSSSTCEYCFCLKGKQTCVKPRCHTPLGKEGCVPRFRPMVCCPVQYDCDGSPALNGTGVQDPHGRPLMGHQANNVRGNDRIIDSPAPAFAAAEKQTVRRRRAPEAEEAMASTETSGQTETDKMEPESATDSPDVTESAASDDSSSMVEEVKKVELEAPADSVKMDTVEAAKPADADPKAEESSNPEPEKSADPAPKPEEPTASAKKPEASADPVPIVEEPAAPAKAEASSDPALEAEKLAKPETKPEASADPVPQPKPEESAGPVPKPEVQEDPASKPEESSDPAPKPEESSEPAPKPEVSAEPASKPEESSDPAPKPEESAEPAPKPEESADPVPQLEESADPAPKPEESADPSPKPEESSDPAPMPEESADPAPKPEEKIEADPEESAAKPDAQDRLDKDDPEDEIDADGAERAIQVSVKHSVSSVTGQKTEAEDPSAVETSRTTQDVSQEKRISSVSVNVSVNEGPSNSTDTEEDSVDAGASDEPKEEESAPESPVSVQENVVPSPPEEEEAEEEQDYDYQHMELPPSLPNLEIIPFVAADAVVGHPNADMDDDERLNLGGVADQRTPISQLSPTGDQSSTTGPEGQKSEPVETPGDDRPSSDPVKVKEWPSSTTLSPLLAFRVTFPPRPSSTLPSSPSPTFIRFPTKRPATTQRPAPPTTTLRTKFNKPAAANNLLGSSFATGGLKVDSCNIYGQVYRVGRIIEELSGPCIECKCTEIGVNCFPLKC